MRTASIVKIHISFWIAAAVFWAAGLGHTFLTVAASVTAHELSHILTARAFGCKVQGLKISALGEAAVIPGMDRLPAWKRTAILAAGPICNLLLWAIFGGVYNLVLFGFNMLPIFPLDGARLFQIWMGNAKGIIRANRWCLCAGRVCCVVLMLLGVVQAAMFFPNITMLLAGAVLWRRNQDLQVDLAGEFYMAMLNKSGKPAKIIQAESYLPISEIIEKMGWDHSLIIKCKNAAVTEKDIILYIISGGDEGQSLSNAPLR